MRYFTPLVDEPTARRRFTRRPLRRLFGGLGSLWRRPPGRIETGPPAPTRPGTGRVLPYAEIVFLPYYLIAFEASAKGRSDLINTVVGGCDSEFAWVDLSHTCFESRPEQEQFPPAIDESQAEQIARNALMSSILRSPGWRGKPVIGRTRSVEIIQYPFWVWYFERRRGLLDIKVLDAVTGKRPGLKLKIALLDAFVNANRRWNSQTSPHP